VASPLRVCSLIVALFGVLLTPAPSHAAQYVVDGFTLGDQVLSSNPNYQSYNCRSSDQFADATQCDRVQNKKGKAGPISVSSTLIHAQDGAAIYVMVNAAPVTLSMAIVQKEIQDLSRAIGASPATVTWFTQNAKAPTSLIVTWGDVKLEELKGGSLDAGRSGKDPDLGMIVYPLGDPALSYQYYDLPMYRIGGGPGYVYSASFDAAGQGHRQYVAIDALQLAIRHFRMSLQPVLRKDQSLARDDYQLWPDVAFITRNLARNTSPKIANEQLDELCSEYHSDKLRSHVWSLLPLGAIDRLKQGVYSMLDVYGPHTDYPDIRRDAESFLATRPSDHFAEFAYFLVGDFDNALKANPNSIIVDVLNYASGYDALGSFLQDALRVAKMHVTQATPAAVQQDLDSMLKGDADLEGALSFFKENPDLYDHKPLGSLMPDFAARAATARNRFATVLRHTSSPLADDSAYWLGWLAVQESNTNDALGYFSQAMVVGNHDYQHTALEDTLRILEQFPLRQQLTTVESNHVLSQQPPLWYEMARSAYRDFGYTSAIDIGQRALKAINVPIEYLPVTTDPGRIREAVEKINPKLSSDLDVTELPYLIQAAKEMSQYEAYLSTAGTEHPDVLDRTARKIILKYSMLIDQPQEPAHAQETVHKDFRQALHLIDTTLRSIQKNTQLDRLREWLDFRKVRIVTQYAPETVSDAVAEMAKEFPASPLLNDALAEQIIAQGMMMGNIDAAQRTFEELLRKYPNGNAIDNAYSWMEIIYSCAGRKQEAQSMNLEIIRRFPFTRHATYARDRVAHPDRSVDPFECGPYWREHQS
jgi:tetratricopeptide (TPR) repeat protein